MRERTKQRGFGSAATTALVACALLLVALQALARAGTANAPVNVHWSAQALVKITLTPNYNSGFGQVPAVIGTQPAPTHGPNAVLNGGSVDFGDVLTGKNYLYKYATELNVTTNDPSGFNVYGEGAADFFNTTDGTSVPISQAIYYLPSTSGSPADPNTGFSPGSPLMKTAGVVSGGGYSGPPPTIAYSVYPAPIATSTSATGTFYYDYELKVPVSATSGLYYVWIVYTVVGK